MISALSQSPLPLATYDPRACACRAVEAPSRQRLRLASIQIVSDHREARMKQVPDHPVSHQSETDKANFHDFPMPLSESAHASPCGRLEEPRCADCYSPRPGYGPFCGRNRSYGVPDVGRGRIEGRFHRVFQWNPRDGEGIAFPPPDRVLNIFIPFVKLCVAHENGSMGRYYAGPCPFAPFPR